MAQAQPIVLTLRMEQSAFARFDALRRAHFPPERNLVPAHISLFHALPGDELGTVKRILEEVCLKHPPMRISVTGLRNLGRGVAFAVESEALLKMRAKLAPAFSDWLTPQDSNFAKPHITVQNKVDPQEARTLLAKLKTGFEPFEFEAIGIDAWSYEGGPWRKIATFLFESRKESTLPR